MSKKHKTKQIKNHHTFRVIICLDATSSVGHVRRTAPRSDIHARAFSEANRKGRLATDCRPENQTLTAGCGRRAKPIHELPTVGRALLLHHRPRESCGTTYTFCSLVNAMEDFRDFVAHFRRKINSWSEIWFAFGGENLEEKNCTTFL